jgi:plastocyanin
VIAHLPLPPAAVAALIGLSPGLAAAGGAIAGKVDVKPARFQDETVVYVKSAPGRRAPATLELDQKGIKFVPFVLPVAVGDTVEFLNHDAVDHDVFSPDHESFHLGHFRAEEHRSYTFRHPGA